MPQIRVRDPKSVVYIKPICVLFPNDNDKLADISGLGRSASSVGPNAHGRHVITKPLRRSKSQLPGDKGLFY